MIQQPSTPCSFPPCVLIFFTYLLFQSCFSSLFTKLWRFSCCSLLDSFVPVLSNFPLFFVLFFKTVSLFNFSLLDSFVPLFSSSQLLFFYIIFQSYSSKCHVNFFSFISFTFLSHYLFVLFPNLSWLNWSLLDSFVPAYSFSLLFFFNFPSYFSSLLTKLSRFSTFLVFFSFNGILQTVSKFSRSLLHSFVPGFSYY